MLQKMCVGWGRKPRERQQRAFCVEASGMSLRTRHKPKSATKKKTNHADRRRSGQPHLVIYRTRRLEHLLAKPVRGRRVNCRAVHKYIIRNLREPAYLVQDPRGQKAKIACR